MSSKPQILFLSHGGGPMPLLGDAGHTEMVDCLKSITSLLRKPSAIVVVSAHWEEKLPTSTAGESPSLIYDYYGLYIVDTVESVFFIQIRISFFPFCILLLFEKHSFQKHVML